MIKLYLPKTKVFGRKEIKMEAVKLLAFAALLGGIAPGSYEVGYVAGACDAAIGRGAAVAPVEAGGGRENAVRPSGVGERNRKLSLAELDGKNRCVAKTGLGETGRGE